jgi:hypothetical protein
MEWFLIFDGHGLTFHFGISKQSEKSGLRKRDGRDIKYRTLNALCADLALLREQNHAYDAPHFLHVPFIFRYIEKVFQLTS